MPVILFPTRISTKSATLIDHIYYFEGCQTKNNLNLYSGNILTDISDHLPNFIILSNSAANNIMKPRPYIRLYTAKNKDKFSKCLACIDWRSALYSCQDANLCFEKFISIVQNASDNCFPLIRQSRRAFKDKIWITNGIKNSSKNKDILFQRWQLTKCASDEIAYRSYKKIYTSLLKKAQIMYYETIFDTKRNSIKKLWSNLNVLCSNSKKCRVRNTIEKLIDDNGTVITSTLEISNCLNDFFCNVGSNLS